MNQMSRGVRALRYHSEIGDFESQFGYHDQMHLVHDFEHFSGETPTNLLTEVEKAHRAVIEAVRLSRLPPSGPDAPRLML